MIVERAIELAPRNPHAASTPGTLRRTAITTVHIAKQPPWRQHSTATARCQRHTRCTCKPKRHRPRPRGGRCRRRRSTMRGSWPRCARSSATTRSVRRRFVRHGCSRTDYCRHFRQPPHPPLPHPHILPPRPKPDLQVLPHVVLQPRHGHVRLWHRRSALCSAVDRHIHRRPRSSHGIHARSTGEAGWYPHKKGAGQVQGAGMAHCLLHCIVVSRNGMSHYDLIRGTVMLTS